MSNSASLVDLSTLAVGQLILVDVEGRGDVKGVVTNFDMLSLKKLKQGGLGTVAIEILLKQENGKWSNAVIQHTQLRMLGAIL